MKHLLLAVAIIAAFALYDLKAETVNPASNVTADTENTNGTIVLRHSSTGVANITLQTGAIDTAKIAAASVDTSKIGTTTADSGKIMVSCAGRALWRVGGTCP